VAINNDKDAPFSGKSTYGIIDDMFEWCRSDRGAQKAAAAGLTAPLIRAPAQRSLFNRESHGELSCHQVYSMATAIIGAFGVFYRAQNAWLLLMKRVQGATQSAGRIGDRVRILFTEVLGQSNVRRKVLPGLAHSLIFFGFLAVQPHSLELMVRGVFAFTWPISPRVSNGGYLFIADILAFLVLLGLGYGLYRRLSSGPPT